MKGKYSPGPVSELLESRLVISLIMFVGDRGHCRKLDLFEELSSDPVVADRIVMVEERGLLETYEVPRSRSLEIALTSEGRAVYRELLEIDDILRNLRTVLRLG